MHRNSTSMHLLYPGLALSLVLTACPIDMGTAPDMGAESTTSASTTTAPVTSRRGEHGSRGGVGARRDHRARRNDGDRGPSGGDVVLDGAVDGGVVLDRVIDE